MDLPKPPEGKKHKYSWSSVLAASVAHLSQVKKRNAIAVKFCLVKSALFVHLFVFSTIVLVDCYLLSMLYLRLTCFSNKNY